MDEAKVEEALTEWLDDESEHAAADFGARFDSDHKGFDMLEMAMGFYAGYVAASKQIEPAVPAPEASEEDALDKLARELRALLSPKSISREEDVDCIEDDLAYLERTVDAQGLERVHNAQECLATLRAQLAQKEAMLKIAERCVEERDETRAQLAERTPEKVLGDIDRERDIQVVCKAVIENCKAYDDNGPDYCMHCYGKDWGKGLEHELNCPVLIAKDLSTGLSALDGKEK